MNAIVPKGWCPTLHAPMRSGDGLLVRLRPPRAILSSTAARLLATASAALGNGTVELTQRAALQVRGLRPETLVPFAAAMVEAGLASDTRTDAPAVIRSPLGESGDVADAVEAAIADVLGLPAKFCVAVDGGGVLPLGEVGADIRVACDSGGCIVAPAGTGRATRCASRDVPAVVAALAGAFLALAAGSAPPPRRMRMLMAAIGPDALFATAGLIPDAIWFPVAACPAVGPVGTAAFGLGLPFGACDLTTLADLADRHGDRMIRLTPWRAIVLTGITDPAAVEADAGDLIVAADDPRSRVVACPGAPACASATIATRPAALALAALGRPGLVHVSGCAKGCAHPGPAVLTLVGGDGCCNLVRDGRASDPPAATFLCLADAIAAA